MKLPNFHPSFMHHSTPQANSSLPLCVHREWLCLASYRTNEYINIIININPRNYRGTLAKC